MRYWILPLALVMMYANFAEAEVADRTVRGGNCVIEADLAGVSAGWAELRTPDGRVVEVPLSELSRADQRWVRRHRRPLVTRSVSEGERPKTSPDRRDDRR